ncbi:stage VI sporulation protein F [Gracilibacillus salitolerans]|uniref:Stage VI sporulation protein F n=1 Tax=Gracilibacillus salitolerans TaxID=2663022 RepID=A0A5Q2TL59_9BACI|nr:stage VI sporulation protein F [Gracilibacillus salitolerans]QGH34802.1 stage VI sporulation protein F [Gracilibacillus salitolerans]
MSDFKQNMFDQIQKQSNVQPDQIMKVAQSVQNADFSDEKTVRKLVKQLARLSGKPVSKQKEDKIVKAITNNKMPKDINSLSKLFKN